MAEAARVFGRGGSVEHKGKRYEVAPLDLDMLAAFEVWLEDNAWRRVERSRGRVSEAVYQERHDRVTAQIGSGVYAFDGASARRAAATTAGKKYLFYLMLSRANREVNEELACEIFEADAVAAQARMDAGSPGPNAEAPAA